MIRDQFGSEKDLNKDINSDINQEMYHYPAQLGIKNMMWTSEDMDLESFSR